MGSGGTASSDVVQKLAAAMNFPNHKRGHKTVWSHKMPSGTCGVHFFVALQQKHTLCITELLYTRFSNKRPVGLGFKFVMKMIGSRFVRLEEVRYNRD